MPNEKSKRILDKDFTDGITGRAGEYKKGAQESIGKAQKYAYEKNDEVEALIREHPKSYVLGAFIGGVALGALLSRRKD
jgi:hypothetical protein